MPERVVAVIRHREAVLACRAGELSLPQRAVAGADPMTAVESLLETLGIETDRVAQHREHGDAMVALVTADEPRVEPSDPCRDPAWVRPATLWEAGSERPWRAYRSVAPSVDTVADDTDRGSTAIAVDALWVLRDAATRVDGPQPLDDIRHTAGQLIDARPSMAVLANRINRVISGADTPADIEAAATEAIIESYTATEEAAALAAQTVADGPVLTLSRSGTVRRALLAGRPAVEVLVSLPGGEGRQVAEALEAAGLSVSLVADAGVYDRCRTGAIGAVLVGADALTADGDLVNKVGTRATALAAELTGTPVYVACASDKIRPPSDADAAEAPLEPMFDVTPSRLITAVLTERGALTSEGIQAVSADHRSWRDWRTTHPG